MGTVDTSGDDWSIACSDDELTKAGVLDGDRWAPDPADLEALYNTIEKTGTLQLEWKCPGRRLPSPAAQRDDNIQESPSSNSTPEKSNFDFKDEMSSLRLRVRREGEDTLRGSAKKKTSSFDGILSNMMRHQKLQQMERDADNP